MKNIFIIAVITFLLLWFTSCKTQQPVYVPVEKIKTEYRDKNVHDSIYIDRYNIIRVSGDTVFVIDSIYEYRNKIVHDSIAINDTISVPYPVEVIKEVEKSLSGWENFQIWCGRIAMGAALLLIAFLIFKWKFKK